jgi:hypothetical protein
VSTSPFEANYECAAAEPAAGSGPAGGGRFFGIPLGDFGFFTSVLMAFTVGFLSFFLFTFLAIFGIMIYNGMGHQVDYAASYKYISSLPAA